MFTVPLKNFIHKHIDLIESNQFNKLYDMAAYELSGGETGMLTTTLLDCGIDPLTYRAQLENCIPPYYLCEAEMEEWIIPEGYTDVRLGCCNRAKIKRIVLPSSLEYIQERAFYSKYIEEVVLPKDIPTIDEHTFNFSNTKIIYPGKISELLSQVQLNKFWENTIIICENGECVIK